MNIGAPWPSLIEAELRVLAMQTKLHQWATADPDRCFDDLANLVYDPAFLVVAWSVLLVARPEADPVPELRRRAESVRLPGDTKA